MKPIVITDLSKNDPRFKYCAGDIVEIIYASDHKLIGLRGEIYNRIGRIIPLYKIALEDGSHRIIAEHNLRLV